MTLIGGAAMTVVGMAALTVEGLAANLAPGGRKANPGEAVPSDPLAASGGSTSRTRPDVRG